jgi:ubiquinone/menaquinone biosynthesis C-methylase UbiE
MKKYKEISPNNLNKLEKFFLGRIDQLNKKCSHTNPTNVKQNIKNFLEGICKEHIFPNLQQNMTGLDIGAGYGLFSEVLKQYSIAVYNLDKNLPKDGLGIQVKGIAEDLPFADKYFDFAAIFYGFNHFDNPKKAFEEACRVVKDKGYLILMMEFSRYAGQKYLTNLNEISMNKIIYGNADGFAVNKTNNYFNKKEFKKLIKNNNLNKILIKDFPPTNGYDKIFKTAKCLYILKKNN